MLLKTLIFLNLQYTEYYVNNGLKTALTFSSKEKVNFINDKDKLINLLEYGDRDD